jgi:WD40 repeat protein
MLAYNLQGGSSIALPTTAIRFRPVTETSRTKNVFLAANAAGAVQHWHMTSGKCLHTLEDDDNQVYALDYNVDGTMFVTAGKDTAVRVYDEATKSVIVKMVGGGVSSIRDAPGHSNRIFSAKFAPDQNIVLTGGWDNTIQFWDIRQGASVRSIYGPHICGDALDICGNEILTGSWRPENQLEIWDYGSGQKISTVPFNKVTTTNSCLLYAAQFSKDEKGDFIVAGGSGANEAKVFDHKNGNALVGTLTGLTRGIFTADFSAGNTRKFAVAGGDATIRIIDIVEKD